MVQKLQLLKFSLAFYFTQLVYLYWGKTCLCETKSDTKSSFWKQEFCFHIECNMLGLLIVENKGFIFFPAKNKLKERIKILFLFVVPTVEVRR